MGKVTLFGMCNFFCLLYTSNRIKNKRKPLDLGGISGNSGLDALCSSYPGKSPPLHLFIVFGSGHIRLNNGKSSNRTLKQTNRYLSGFPST